MTRPTPALIFAAMLVGAAAWAEPSPSPSPCPSISGTPWFPHAAGADGEDDQGTSVEMRSVLSKDGPVEPLASPVPKANEIEFEIPMDVSLEDGGSISLVAEATGIDGASGGNLDDLHPLLVSLDDGKHDWINLPREGKDGDCVAAGYVVCDEDDLCTATNSCQTRFPSAYDDSQRWFGKQFDNGVPASVNTFPNCNWSGGSPACAFNTTFFEDGRLRAGKGVVYKARYVLLYAGDGKAPARAKIKLTVIRNARRLEGQRVIDLNIVLVGSENIQASRTPKGKANLDALLAHFQKYYGQDTVNVRLGQVQAVEWGCELGGDAYESVEYSDMPKLVAQGTAALPPDSEGKALNVFLVSTITQDRLPSVLGRSGAIGGPAINGLGESGLVFASLGMLDTFNPACVGDEACPLSKQDADFVDMGSTIAHESGHYLGLYHPSESSGTRHDPVPDTPVCTAKGPFQSSDTDISNQSCGRDTNVSQVTGKTCEEVCPAYDGHLNFCPEKVECAFNHVMWWTSKEFNPLTGEGDGNIFSPESARIMRYHPLVR